MKRILLFIIPGLTLFAASCANHKTEEPKPASECDASQATFSAHVNPIIQTNCAITGCHVAGFPNGDYTTYDGLKVNVDNGKFKHSVIDQNVPMMPPTGKLPDDQIRILQCWLENGAPNN